MPCKHRDIRGALTGKGFEVNTQRDHIFLTYRREDGKLTTARTKLSHANSGHDISDSLLRQMAKQVKLSAADFLRLVDCPLTRKDYEQTSGV